MAGDPQGAGFGGAGIDGGVDAGAAGYSKSAGGRGEEGPADRGDERVAGGYASAAGRLRLRPFWVEGGWAVDRRQRGERDLREVGERDRLRRGGEGYRGVGGAAQFHFVRAVLRSVASLWVVEFGPAV